MTKKIDYAAEIAKTKGKIEAQKVNAIVLAPPGGGKSSLAGTFGVPTLYLYSNSEAHGPVAANTYANCEITALCIDQDRTPDQAMEFLMGVLSDKEFLEGFGAIVLDSATSLELIIRETSAFSEACLTSAGKKNGYAEGPAALVQFNAVLELMRSSGKHTLVACVLDVKDKDSETGEILESTPRLGTYALAENIILQHADIFIIGPLTKDDKTGHRIQFSARMEKASKDLTGRIKKLLNFTPRITGVKVLPNSMPPLMSGIIKLKQKGKSDATTNI